MNVVEITLRIHFYHMNNASNEHTIPIIVFECSNLISRVNIVVQFDGQISLYCLTADVWIIRKLMQPQLLQFLDWGIFSGGLVKLYGAHDNETKFKVSMVTSQTQCVLLTRKSARASAMENGKTGILPLRRTITHFRSFLLTSVVVVVTSVKVFFHEPFKLISIVGLLDS